MFKIEFKPFSFFNPKSKQNMKHAKFSAILGRDVKVGEILNAEDLTKISAHLGDAPTEATTTENAGASNATENVVEQKESTQNPAETSDLSAMITAAVTAAVQPVQAQIATISQRLETVEGKAGAETTQNPVVTGDAKKVHSWENPNSPINQKIANDLGE